MNKETFESLLNNLNKEEKEKFNYILNFYTKEHVYHNFDMFRQSLKQFKVFQVEEFCKPVDESLKKLLDKIDLKSIFEMLETFKVSFYGNTENKSVTDLLIYLTTFANVRENTRYKIIENSAKYKRVIECKNISPQEILDIISKNFEKAINFGEKLDLEKIEEAINFELYEKLRAKTSREILLEDLYEKEPVESRVVALSEMISRSLTSKDIREAYAKDGNVVTKDKSILVIKYILQEEFENADEDFIERLKAMLKGFNLAKISQEDIELFREHINDISQKGLDIEDLFFIKNISSSQTALLAYSELPEELKKQVLSLNVIAPKDEIEKVLSALVYIKEGKQKENQNSTNFDCLNEKTTFGIELELNGISPKVLQRLIEDKTLYSQFKEKYGLTLGLYNWKIDYDGTVPDGVEVISPVMSDTPKNWKSLEEVCIMMKVLDTSIGGNCGGHIHIGTNILGTDEKAWKNLFKIWELAEPIIYKVSNKAGEDFRKATLKEASPVSNIIKDMFEKDIIRIKSSQDVINVATEYSKRYLDGISTSGRTKAMNLQCIAEGKQNTIEFRIPNSSLDFEELKSNIKFFGRMVEVSKQLSLNEEYKKDIFQRFLTSDKEEERMYAFVDLLFDDEKDKNKFYERYFSREKNLIIGEKNYSEIKDREVGVNESARYEWRDHR